MKDKTTAPAAKASAFSDRWKNSASSARIQEARRNLVTAFSWANSPQGADAWRAVYDALGEMLTELDKTK